MNSRAGIFLSIILIIVVFAVGVVMGSGIIKSRLDLFGNLGLSPGKINTGAEMGLPDLKWVLIGSVGGCGTNGNITICSMNLFGNIENSGDASANSFHARFSDITNGSIVIEEKFVPRLGPGGIVALNTSYREIPPGQYTIEWFADSRENIIESNETNNKIAFTFSIP